MVTEGGNDDVGTYREDDEEIFDDIYCFRVRLECETESTADTKSKCCRSTSTIPNIQ